MVDEENDDRDWGELMALRAGVEIDSIASIEDSIAALNRLKRRVRQDSVVRGEISNAIYGLNHFRHVQQAIENRAKRLSADGVGAGSEPEWPEIDGGTPGPANRAVPTARGPSR